MLLLTDIIIFGHFMVQYRISNNIISNIQQLVLIVGREWDCYDQVDKQISLNCKIN